MTGDYTSVPLRAGGRWTGARMQQGRVLLDGDYNLTVDGASRENQSLAAAAIGPAGVPEGSSAFGVSFASDGTLQIGAGEMWVGGLRAVNPAPFAYGSQESVPPLPTGGNVLVYLDAFVEEVQAAEDQAGLLDPALDGIDTMTRTRVGWRVRAEVVKESMCAGAAAALPQNALSNGLLDVVRTSPPVVVDPCAPPDDPRGKLPDGLFRIEVLDSGSESTARFAWSYENSSAAVAADVAGTTVTLKPSPDVDFFPGDQVEVSTLVRRADRLDHGTLFEVDRVDPGAGGSVVTLKTAPSLSGKPAGLCLRRWDGQTVGAATQVTATLEGVDVGVAFRASPGDYLVGDWWAVRVRGSSADTVEEIKAAPAEGTRHFVTALAVVDLNVKAVLSDCRPHFPALTEIRPGTCTVIAFPSDDLQAAVDKLPADGGELCLAAGTYPLDSPVVMKKKKRITVTGVGPATVLTSRTRECLLRFEACQDITVRDLRAESGTASQPGASQGEEHLLGAITFVDCTDVTVRDCEVACPDSPGRAQSAVFAGTFVEDRPTGPVRVLDNKLEVGAQQAGVVVVSATEATIARNEIRLKSVGRAQPTRVIHPRIVEEIARFVGSHVIAEDAESGHEIPLPGDATMRVAGASVIQRLAGQFGRTVTEKALAKSTPRKELQRFTRRALLAPNSLHLSRESGRFLLEATRARSMSQGIVVGGMWAELIRIEDNLVSGAIQGIHVGLSGRGGATSDAKKVVINGNVVACAIPFFWSRDRHAYYVGSTQSLTMTDNKASLSRIGGPSKLLDTVAATPVEAVRVYGRIGHLLRIQGLDLTGPFTTGVALYIYRDWSIGSPGEQLLYVSDVVNARGGPALTPNDVPHDRCVP